MKFAVLFTTSRKSYSMRKDGKNILFKASICAYELILSKLISSFNQTIDITIFFLKTSAIFDHINTFRKINLSQSKNTYQKEFMYSWLTKSSADL